MSNDSVRRIMAEVKEFNALNNSPTTFFYAAPMETDLFEWHFSVRGPPDTPFADGVYHGRIVLPGEYPLKPPEIILLTPNGRFEVGKRICLSVTAHHQETWQPSWGIRTILTALVGFMPSKAEGVAALGFPDSDRRRLARLSWSYSCDRCGARPIEQLHVPLAVQSKFPGAFNPPLPESTAPLSPPIPTSDSKLLTTEASSSSIKQAENETTSPDSTILNAESEKSNLQIEESKTVEVAETSTSPINSFASMTSPDAEPLIANESQNQSISHHEMDSSSSKEMSSNRSNSEDKHDTTSISSRSIDITSTSESSRSTQAEATGPPQVEQEPQPSTPAISTLSNSDSTRRAGRQTSRQPVQEPELLFLAYAIAAAIFAIVLHRVYITL